MKELRLALYGRGSAEELFMWFAVLGVSSNEIPIDKKDFEPMRIAEHQLTQFYSVLLMLGTPSGEEKLKLDANYYLKLSMHSSGHQPISMTRLHPYWEGALDGKGTSQIILIGDAEVIPEDYSRLE